MLERPIDRMVREAKSRSISRETPPKRLSGPESGNSRVDHWSFAYVQSMRHNEYVILLPCFVSIYILPSVWGIACFRTFSCLYANDFISLFRSLERDTSFAIIVHRVVAGHAMQHSDSQVRVARRERILRDCLRETE